MSSGACDFCDDEIAHRLRSLERELEDARDEYMTAVHGPRVWGALSRIARIEREIWQIRTTRGEWL
ncbi:hypothetical protein CL629_00885 [bacterium]|nr:hypothetical protein [bacterium]